MARTKSQKKALSALNYDLFKPESMGGPAPATLYTKIRQYQSRAATIELPAAYGLLTGEKLPTQAELYRMYERFNWLYFHGKLPAVQIEYSNRMRCAGSYTPVKKLIRIGRKYHDLFPAEIADTLKHEMIHIIHIKHDMAFRAEAQRIGASVKAKYHPSLRKQPKYLYICPGCGMEYPRQKRLRMASCGECSPGRKFDRRFKLRLKSE
ncbi:MAG: SprT-like domain-containing protein [Candidatus Zixiibacteriota bacterium]